MLTRDQRRLEAAQDLVRQADDALNANDWLRAGGCAYAVHSLLVSVPDNPEMAAAWRRAEGVLHVVCERAAVRYGISYEAQPLFVSALYQVP